MMTGGSGFDPDRIRETLLKLEIQQFARGELHVLKQDLREILERDLKEHKRDVQTRNRRFFAVAITVVTILVGGDIWTVRDTLRRLEKQAQDAVNREVEGVRARASATLASEVQSVRLAVSDRLNREFETPRLRALVEEKAKEYAERQARQYLTQKVDQSLQPVNEKMNRSATEIENLRNLLFAAEQAMDGDLRAYLQLVAVAREQSERGRIAAGKLTAILRDLSQYRQPPGFYENLALTLPNGKQVPLNEISTGELFRMLQDPTLDVNRRRAMMAYIVNKPKPEVVSSSIQVLNTSQYLPTIAATCGILGAVFNNQSQFLNVQWWLDFLKKQH